MSRKIKRTDCYGCYNEDYHSGLGGYKKCCSYEGATLSLGRKQGTWTLPKHYGGRWKSIPDCYQNRDGIVQRKT